MGVSDEEECKAWADKLYTQLIIDDNNWGKIDSRELVCRVNAYKSDSENIDVINKLLTGLWMGEILYLCVGRDNPDDIFAYRSSLPYFHRTRLGRVFDVFTSEDEPSYRAMLNNKIAPDKLPHLMQNHLRYDMPDYIMINPNRQRVLLPAPMLAKTFKTFAGVLLKIDKFMLYGIYAEKLTDLLFERFCGRDIECRLFSGRKIVGEVYEKKRTPDGLIMYVKTKQDDRFELRVEDVMFIKDTFDMIHTPDWLERHKNNQDNQKRFNQFRGRLNKSKGNQNKGNQNKENNKG